MSGSTGATVNRIGTGRTEVSDFFTKKIPLFSVFSAFENNQAMNFVVLGCIVYFFQHLAFVVNPHFDATWSYMLGEEVSKTFYAFHFAIFDQSLTESASSTTALILMCVLLLFELYICAVLAYYRLFHAGTDKQNDTFVFVNRAVLHGLSTFLFIPSMQLTFGVMPCVGNRMALYPNDVECWSGEHIGMLCMSLIYLVPMVPIAYLTLACQFDGSIHSHHVKARSHTLIDMAALLHSISSCLLFSVMIPYNYKGAFAVIHSVKAFVVMALHAYYLPYFSLTMNRFFVSTHALEAFAAAVAAGGMLHEDGRNALSPPVLLIGVGPIVFTLAWILAPLRVSGTFLHALQLVELGLGNVYGRGSIPAGLDCNHKFLRDSLSEVPTTLFELNSRGGGVDGGGSRKAIAHPEVCETYIESVRCPEDVDLASRFCQQYIARLNQSPGYEMMHFAMTVYLRGSIRFPKSASVLLHMSRFICQVIPSLGSVGLQLIEEIDDLHASVSIRYQEVNLADDLRSAIGIKSQAHLMHANGARRMHSKVLTHMNAFWLKLQEPSVNIGQVSLIADEINLSRKKALVQFKRAVQHQSSPDPQLISRMGHFLNDVLLDSEGATECFNEAREVHEAKQAKSMRGTRQHTTMLDAEGLNNQLLQLLTLRKDSYTTAASSVVRYLLLNVTVVFLIILGMGGLFLFASLDQRDRDLSGIDKSLSGGYVRAIPQRLVSMLYEIELKNTTDTTYSNVVEESSLYADHFKRLTSGVEKATYAPHVQFFEERRIPVITTAVEEQYPRSLWELGEQVSNAFSSFLLTNSTSSTAATFAKEAVVPLTLSLDRSMELHDEEHVRGVRDVLSILISAFVIGMAAITAIYISFQVSFYRTQLGRVFTFQLFTLIPFDALEKLSSDTREKINSIEEETRREKQTQDAMGASQTLGASTTDGGAGSPVLKLGESDDDRKVSTASSSLVSSTHSRNNSMMNLIQPQQALVSCLKKPGGAPKPRRKVVISTQVTVFGEEADEQKKSQQTAGDEQRQEELVEEEDNKVASERKPREATKNQGTSNTWQGALVAITLSVFVFIVIAEVLVGLSIGTVEKGRSGHKDVVFQQFAFESVSLTILEVEFHTMAVVRANRAESIQDVIDVFMTTDVEQLAMKGEYDEDTARSLTAIQVVLYKIQDLVYDAITAYAISTDDTMSSYSVLANRVSGFDSAAFLTKRSAQVDELREKNSTSPIGSKAFYGELAIELASSKELKKLLLDVLEGMDAAGKRVVESIDDANNWENELSGLVFASITIWSFIIALCIALTTVNASWWSGGRVGRGFWLTGLFLCLVPLVLLTLFVQSRGNMETAIDHHKSLDKSIYGVIRSGRFGSVNAHLFVLREESEPWFTYIESLDEASGTKTVDLLREESLVVPLEQELKRLLRASDQLRDLHRIANAMTIHVMNSTGKFVEAQMFDSLDHTEWEYVTEKDYLKVESEFQGRSPKYSIKVQDLALPSDVLRQLSGATVFDRRYLHIRDNLVHSQDAIFASASQKMGDRVDSASAQSQLLLIIAVSTGAAPFIWAMFGCWRLLENVARILGLTSSSSTHTLDTTLYTRMLQKCRWSLFFVAILFCAVFGVAVWSTRTMTGSIANINTASKRDFFVITSLQHLRQALLSTTTTHSSVDFRTVEDDNRMLKAAISDLAFDELTDGKLNAVADVKTYDELMYGVDDHVTREAISRTHLGTMCDPPTNPLSFPRGPYGGLTYPVESYLHFWIGALDRVVHLSSTGELRKSNRDVIENIAAELGTLEPQLLAGLRQSTDELKQAAKSTVDRNTTILVTIIVVLLVSVTIVYVGIFFPIVQRLVEEEESARLLLRMIPVHVRDQVPAISEYIETGKIDNAAELQKKFEASEKLLQNILPQKIAARLKSGESPIADMHPSLTILFTDFVGFTKRSSTMQADEIVDFLNEVFMDFDLIVDLLELEKIKTIGDAYFMAGGLDPRICDHALRVVEAAIHMFDSLHEHNERHPSRALLRMRLGIHTGPAVAGVIGTKKVAYDLWGESVEIANAMESTAVPDRVHISEPTAQLIHGYFELAPRGELPREKESVPENMPKTYLVGERLLPSPYQHIHRPRQFRQRIGGGHQR